MNTEWSLNKAELIAGAQRSVDYSAKYFVAFGICCVFGFPAASIVEQALAPHSVDTTAIRVTAAALSTGLFFYPYINAITKGRFYVYWILLITYVGPFTFGLMLVLSAVLSSSEENTTTIWVFQYLVALFLMIQLINHASLTLLSWGLGSILALSAVFFIDEPNWGNLKAYVLYPSPIYLTAILVGALSNRNIHIAQQEKLRATTAIGANIAHELRTPLASIASFTRGLHDSLPLLLETFSSTRLPGQSTELPPRKIQAIKTALGNIEGEVAYANTIIDMLLISSSTQTFSKNEFENFSAGDCVEESIRRYPFNNAKERSMVKWNTKNDFMIHGPRLATLHVLFNLIKNALYYTQRKGGREIRLIVEQSSVGNTIRIADEGPGIPFENRNRIYQYFFTTTENGQGAGIGLSYCKVVMEAIGGRIGHKSSGSGTTFTLLFPDDHAEVELQSPPQPSYPR